MCSKQSLDYPFSQLLLFVSYSRQEWKHHQFEVAVAERKRGEKESERATTGSCPITLKHFSPFACRKRSMGPPWPGSSECFIWLEPPPQRSPWVPSQVKARRETTNKLSQVRRRKSDQEATAQMCVWLVWVVTCELWVTEWVSMCVCSVIR